MTLLGAGARLVDVAGGRTLAGAELSAEVGRRMEALAELPVGVVFARMSVDLPSVLTYLGAFESGRAIALIDPALDVDVLAGLVERFRPAAVLSASGDAPAGYTTRGDDWIRSSADGVAPHPDLAVLLPTSGSTGNPKLVRLSRQAILSNADAIAQVLHIDADEVAPTCLPLHYSYGLSVLNSHLVRDATVVIEPSGVLGRGFWDAVNTHGVTSLSGVPYHYEMLRRLKFDPAKYPTLRTLTQAGWEAARRPDHRVQRQDDRRRRPDVRDVRPDRGGPADDDGARRAAGRKARFRRAGAAGRPVRRPPRRRVGDHAPENCR